MVCITDLIKGNNTMSILKHHIKYGKVYFPFYFNDFLLFKMF